MNRLALAAVVLLSSLAFAEDLAPAAFKTELEKQQGLVLDVRTPGEVAQGKIANASVIDITAEGFERKVGLIDREKPVFVYCRSGGRSGRAVEVMTKLGFKKIYNLSGGITAWSAAGLPLDTTNVQPVTSGETTSPEAFDAALKKDKRVLVSFHTKWCTPCQKMAPVFDALSVKGVKLVKVDVDASDALAAREKVQGVPVFVLYVDGKEKGRLTGEQTKQALEALAARK